MSSISKQLKVLIRLASVDNKFDDSERYQILAIGKANGVSQEEIDRLINEEMTTYKDGEKLNFGILTFDEKFEYLYNIIQLMKIDHKIFLSEIKYCEKVASQLGFDKKVVGKMSSMVYSDPLITSNRDELKQQVKKSFIFKN